MVTVRESLRTFDYCNQAVNERVLQNELKKLDKKGKQELAEKLLAESKGEIPSTKPH